MRFFLVTFLFISQLSIFSNDLFDSSVNNVNISSVEDIFFNISSHKLAVAEFFQSKTIKRLNKTIKSSGNMIFDSSKGIAWDILKPFASVTVLTDDAMIQKSPSGQVRKISAHGNETFHRFSKTIQSVFLGQIDLIFAEYELFYLRDQLDRWKIGLVPKDSALQNIVKAFEISGTDFIEVFTIHEANGDNILYEFRNITFPDHLTEDQLNVFP